MLVFTLTVLLSLSADNKNARWALTKFIYIKNLYGDIGRAKYELTQKIDAEGNITSFQYSVNEDDNYKNALLTKIKFPTGLENCLTVQGQQGLIMVMIKWATKH